MNRSPSKNVVVVDGYSSGRVIAQDLKDMGANVFHLHSTPVPPEFLRSSLDTSSYRRDLNYLGTPEEATATLLTLGVDCVIAGCEMGVSFAERLAHLVGTSTNLYHLVRERRNKFHMIEALHRHRLHAAQQALVSAEEQAVAWATQHGRWPVVVKPLDSAASDNVSICQNLIDVRLACRKALGAKTLFGDTNKELVVQSWLDGPMYVVNTVSRDGRHFMTDAWLNHIRLIRDDTIFLDSLEWLNPDSDIASKLLSYTFEALDALGIVNGPAHSEVKWTANGPALVETGARLMGGAMDRESYTAAGLKCQSTYFALDLLQPDSMNALRDRRDRCAPGRHITKIFFDFNQYGTIKSVEGLKRLNELRTFHAIYRPLPAGTRVQPTALNTGYGGTIYLVHDDSDLIKQDRETIRKWHQNGMLYQIALEAINEPEAA